MSDAEGNYSRIELACPECGNEERTSIVPTFTLGAELDVEVKSVSCVECGYDGPP